MKINILFFIVKVKTNNSGKCAIKCRLAFHKKRKEFSTGIFINPRNWVSKQQEVKPPEPDADIINT